MNETIVINKYHLKSHNELDVYIGRGSPWGNPYSSKDGTKALYKVDSKEESIEEYKKMWLKRLEKNPEHSKRMLLSLKGKRLVCSCKPKACHGDVLVDLINKL